MNFSKQDTKMIKGVAIIFMLMHHLWGFPDRYYNGTVYYGFLFNGKNIWVQLGQFGQICVSIFAFLGGYALYINCNKEHYFLRKIQSLYFGYWKVFAVVVPIGFLFFREQEVYCKAESLCSVFGMFSIESLMMNFLGVFHTYNAEWWFFLFFIKCIFVGVVFAKLCKKINNYYLEFLIILLIMFLTDNLVPTIAKYDDALKVIYKNFLFEDLFDHTIFKIMFLFGITFAKYNLLNQVYGFLEEKNKIIRKFVAVFTIIIIFFMRTMIVRNMDYIYVPIMIVSLYELLNVTVLKNAFSYLGGHSANIYYSHTFFCYYFGITASMVYKINNPVMSLINLLLISLAFSIIINKMYEWINKLLKKIKLV